MSDDCFVRYYGINNKEKFEKLPEYKQIENGKKNSLYSTNIIKLKINKYTTFNVEMYISKYQAYNYCIGAFGDWDMDGELSISRCYVKVGHTIRINILERLLDNMNCERLNRSIGRRASHITSTCLVGRILCSREFELTTSNLVLGNREPALSLFRDGNGIVTIGRSTLERHTVRSRQVFRFP